MAKILRKVFLHVIDYDNAPEFAVLADGTVQIDGKEQENEAKIVEALRANAKAWGECVDRAVVVEELTAIESAKIKDIEGHFVQTYTGLAVRGPWPAPASAPVGNARGVDDVVG